MLATARAELLARLRDPNFIVLLLALVAATTLLVPPESAPYATMTIGDRRLRLDSGSAGTESGVVFGLLASLVALLALTGDFTRDRKNGFAETLAAMPLSWRALALGRIAAVFATCAIVVAATSVALGITLALRLGHVFDPLRFETDFVVLSLPAIAVSAALGVLFELLTVARRGAFVAAAVATWLALSVLALTPIDIFGESDVAREAARFFGNMPISTGIVAGLNTGSVAWSGLRPDFLTVMHRAFALGSAFVAASIVLLLPGSLRLAEHVSRNEKRVRGALATGAASTVDFSAIQTLPREAFGFAHQLAVEIEFRLRTNRVALALTLLLAVCGAFVPNSVRIVGAAALLLPMLWSRSFDADMTAREEADMLVARGAAAWSTPVLHACSLAAVSLLPVTGLIVRLAAEHSIAAATLAGAAILEAGWLSASRHRVVLNLAVCGLAWYVVVFNALPAPFDYAGLTDPSFPTAILDLILAATCVGISLFSSRGSR